MAAMSKVLGDEDLLRGILLRVGFPTTLVRASLVCRRWYLCASDPAFLRRFRDLHPPRLLGFYLELWVGNWRCRSRFVPMPLPPEIGVSRGSFDFETYQGLRRCCPPPHLLFALLGGYAAESVKVQCWRGNVFAEISNSHKRVQAVRSPLLPGRDSTIVPPFPSPRSNTGFTTKIDEFVPNYGAKGPSFIFLSVRCSTQRSVANVYVLQDGAWSIHTSASAEIPSFQAKSNILLVDSRIFVLAKWTYRKDCVLILLDLSSSSFSVIELPEEMEIKKWYNGANALEQMYNGTNTLLWADDSGVYLIYAIRLQVHIWLHSTNSDGVGNWLLADTINLREICATQGISSRVLDYGHDAAGFGVHMAMYNAEFLLFGWGGGHNTAGSRMRMAICNAEFLLFEMGDGIIYSLDVRSRAVQKVHECDMTVQHHRVAKIHPFMMIWPPVFPALMDGCD
ncbi:hypothetical protein ACP70R_047194 [Stipagrostis hirtigluma subsp. patula]